MGLLSSALLKVKQARSDKTVQTKADASACCGLFLSSKLALFYSPLKCHQKNLWFLKLNPQGRLVAGEGGGVKLGKTVGEYIKVIIIFLCFYLDSKALYLSNPSGNGTVDISRARYTFNS